MIIIPIKPGTGNIDDFKLGLNQNLGSISNGKLYLYPMIFLVFNKLLKIAELFDMFKICQRSRREIGSTPVVGSSRKIIFGWCIKVQISASFCFIHPESSSARSFRNDHNRVISNSCPFPYESFFFY